MADEKKDDHTNPTNPKLGIKPSTVQLSELICKMLEESMKALATIDLEYALACFEVDQ